MQEVKPIETAPQIQPIPQVQTVPQPQIQYEIPQQQFYTDNEVWNLANLLSTQGNYQPQITQPKPACSPKRALQLEKARAAKANKRQKTLPIATEADLDEMNVKSEKTVPPTRPQSVQRETMREEDVPVQTDFLRSTLSQVGKIALIGAAILILKNLAPDKVKELE